MVQGPGQTHRLLNPVRILAGRPGIPQCLFCWTHGARRSIAWFAVDLEYIATSTWQAARARCTFLSAIASADIRSSFSCKDIAWMYCLLLGITACRAGHIEDGRKPCPLACRRTVATLQSLHYAVDLDHTLEPPAVCAVGSEMSPNSLFWPLHQSIYQSSACCNISKLDEADMIFAGMMSTITFAAPKSPASQPLAAVKLQLWRSDRYHRCGYTSIQELVRTHGAKLNSEV